MGFNQPRPTLRTVAVSIDLSKAFDTISHNNNTVRWLSTYLRGRLVCYRYNNTLFPYKHLHVGVPQGSCISPHSSISSSPLTHTPHTSHHTLMTSQTPPPIQITLRPPRPSRSKLRVFRRGPGTWDSPFPPQSHQLHFSHPTDTKPTHTPQSPLTTPHSPWPKKTRLFGGHPRPPFHLWLPHNQPHLPRHPPPQCPQGSCWHNLGPAS